MANPFSIDVTVINYFRGIASLAVLQYNYFSGSASVVL